MNSETVVKHILTILNLNQQSDKPAFIYYEEGEERTLSYLDFKRWIASFYQTIESQKIPTHSTVFLVGENSPKWPAAYLAAHLKGHTVIHGDFGYTEKQFTTIVNFTKPSLILCDKKFNHYFDDNIKKIFLDEVNPLPSDLGLEITPLAVDQPMSIIFTSGTTSSPKGVMLSEANFLSNLKVFESMGNLISSQDKIVAILPFHHVYPFTCTVLAPLYFGATLVYPASLRGEDVFGAIKKHKGTILVAVPRVLELFCHRIFETVELLPQWKRSIFKTFYTLSALMSPFGLKAGKLFFPSIHSNFPSFRFFACGGSRLDIEVERRLLHLGFPIVEAYGLTETSPIASINELNRPVLGSVGRPPHHVAIDIQRIDPHLTEGEICIQGPNVMMGYYQRPDLTGKAIIDGWFHSGDLGYLDKKGYLFITGRKDEMIVLANGKNIYPEELEKHYQESEKIKELCIVLLREEGKEFLTAVVYPNKEFFRQHRMVNISHEIKFDLETAAENLPPYQRITRIELVDEEFPRTSLGKIKRFQIPGMLRKKEAAFEGQKEVPEQGDEFLIWVKDFLKLKKLPDLKSNLEIDLGLDSLSKIEFISSLEKKYCFQIKEEQIGAIFTLADIKKLMPQTVFSQTPSEETIPEETLLAKTLSKEIGLEDKILIPPYPPLAEHVSTDNNPLAMLVRFCFYLLFKIVLKLFFKAELEGKEFLKDLKPPFIIAPNHNSYIDALIIYALFPFSIINNCFFISFPRYFATFPLSLIQKIGRIILTGTQDTAIKSLQYSYQVLTCGKIMCVFPEGGRSLDGKIETPKKGIGYVAKQSKSPLLPVYIQGTQALLSRKRPGLHKAILRAYILPPISAGGEVGEFLNTWRKKLENYHKEKSKIQNE